MSFPRLLVPALLLGTCVACSSRRPIEHERSWVDLPVEASDSPHPHVGCELAPRSGSSSEQSDTPSGAEVTRSGTTPDPDYSDRSSGAPPPGVSSSDDSETVCFPAAPGTSDDSLPPPEVPTPSAPIAADVTHAILVSVDGLAARYLDQVIAAGMAPTFRELQSLGAWTHDARTDKTYTITLPNHTSMLTGLPVTSAPGLESFRAHFYTANTDPAPSETLHTLRYPARAYTPSVFDVVHDNGLTTAMFASKTKFSLFVHTYNEAGRADTIGVDNGRKKIDEVVIDVDPETMVDQLVSRLAVAPPSFTFVHLNQPDGTGHAIGWGSPEYLDAVSRMDGLLGRILGVLRANSLLASTALIVTTDHGGIDTSHFDPNDPSNFRIPFYVVAPGVPAGDAYAAFENRFRPADENPEYHDPRQPLRNGDAGNLALYLLGLPPVPESVIHSAKPKLHR